jgi:hypothetical protein
MERSPGGGSPCRSPSVARALFDSEGDDFCAVAQHEADIVPLANLIMELAGKVG